MCTSSPPPVWTFAELRKSYSRREIDQFRATAQLQSIRRGIYVGPGACDVVRTAAAHGGGICCETAARHLGVWVLEDHGVHVWMHENRHQYAHTVDECGCVPHWDAGPATSAFATPSVQRILRQIYGCRGAEAFFVALESARRKNLISRRGLNWLRRKVDSRGKDLIDFSRSDADSGLESLVRLRLRHHGWDVRTQMQIFTTGRVDLVIDDWLIVEADGKDNHDDEPHRHKDLVRDANSAIWGYLTLRFDYAMIVHDWETVEAAIVAVMSRRARA